VDGLLYPDRSGGIGNVLGAWALARDLLDEGLIVYGVERLGLSHPALECSIILCIYLEEWRAGTERGGSRKLLASAPYSPDYDNCWDLSINAPVEALENRKVPRRTPRKLLEASRGIM
jgi:hypothetical protein